MNYIFVVFASFWVSHTQHSLSVTFTYYKSFLVNTDYIQNTHFFQHCLLVLLSSPWQPQATASEMITPRHHDLVELHIRSHHMSFDRGLGFSSLRCNYLGREEAPPLCPWWQFYRLRVPGWAASLNVASEEGGAGRSRCQGKQEAESNKEHSGLCSTASHNDSNTGSPWQSDPIQPLSQGPTFSHQNWSITPQSATQTQGFGV